MTKKGFIAIIVFSALAVIILVAVVIVTLGSGEIIQIRTSNDSQAAYYAAIAGAEDMYTRLRSVSDTASQVVWPESISATNVQIGGATVGSYSVVADITSQANVFMISSTGTANGRSVTVTTKYGFTSSYTNGLPIGAVGPMSLTGHRIRLLFWWLTYGITADGPIECGSTVTPNSSTNGVYVTYSGTVAENSTDVSPMSFWMSPSAMTNLDVNNDGQYVTDTNGDGSVTAADAQDAAQLAIFTADNVAADTVIDNKDAFVYYYTGYLNQPQNNPTGTDLGISGPGDTNYYSGDTNFGPSGVFSATVPSGSQIVFVDGDASIVFNAQDWWNNESDLTVIATGDITIVQPWNGSNDRLNLISYGDIYTGGFNLGDVANVQGNINMLACGNFNAILGGSTNGSNFANGITTIDTEAELFGFLPIYSSRDINQGTDSWASAADKPLGLPPGFPVVTKQFVINQELGGGSGGYPIWQRR